MDIKFNKGLGQNFIFDTNLLKAITQDAQINQDDTVIEIGAGAGTLTRELSKKAKKVISYEIDRSLEPILKKNLADCPNVQLILKDFLNEDLKELNNTLNNLSLKVNANLPYYITTPILFKLIESDLNINSITILVQKEVAERICAKQNSSEYSALTLTIASCYNAKITRIVNRKMFVPSPKVDSAVVHLSATNKFDPQLNKTIRSLFLQKRKTVVNNLISAFNLPRQSALDIITATQLNPLIRPQQLSLDDIKKINAQIKQIIEI